MVGKKLINAARVRKIINDRVTKVSFADFFTIIGCGVGIGLIMSCFETESAFIASIVAGSTVMATAFCIFFIPKVKTLLHGETEKGPVGENLARGPKVKKGEKRDVPRLKASAKIRIIEPEY